MLKQVQHDIFTDYDNSATAWKAGIQKQKDWIPGQARNDNQRKGTYDKLH